MGVEQAFEDLEARVQAGESIRRADVERVLASPDLIGIGVLGETQRRRISGDEVTFGRVLEVPAGSVPTSRSEAGEVRLVSVPASIEAACESVRAAAALAAGVPLTGFSAWDLLVLCGHDHLALADAAHQLKAAGLEAVAACPIDRFSRTEETVDVLRALLHGGLAVRRLTVDFAQLAARLDLAERAAEIQAETGAVRAFAPLPRIDPIETPSTGYDDVRCVAATRLLCAGIERIQVDWPLYGPKLAQVALTYGANDIDGVSAVDSQELGPRRAPREEIVRQIRAAACVPVERNGRYEHRSFPDELRSFSDELRS
jgi:aminodeoxyfutalosine synthase